MLPMCVPSLIMITHTLRRSIWVRFEHILAWPQGILMAHALYKPPIPQIDQIPFLYTSLYSAECHFSRKAMVRI